MKRFLLIVMMALTFHSAFSKEVRKTFSVADFGEFTIVYDVTQNDNETVIRFSRVIKNLTDKGRSSIKDTEKLDIAFFDEVTAFDNISFVGLEPKPLRMSFGLSYVSGFKGYFFIKELPELVFNKSYSKDCEIVIPLYLAYFEKKGKVKLLEGFSDLVLNLNVENADLEADRIRESSDSGEELKNSGNNPDLVMLCSAIRNNLKRQNELPFDDILSSHIDELGEMQRQKLSVADQRLINEILDRIDAKRHELKTIEKQKQEESQREAEMREKQAAAEMKAEQDAIREAEAQKEKEKEQRNMWIIVCGGVLSILGFGGSQLMQHIRNSKNQKSMMEMQQSIMKEAEGNAKRRVQSYVSNKTIQTVNKARTNGRNAVREQLAKSTASKKNFTI